jgi:hypothetical protein
MPDDNEVLTVHIRVVGDRCEALPRFRAKRKSEVFFDLEDAIRDTTTITFNGNSPFEKEVKHGKNKVKSDAGHGDVTYTVEYTGQKVGKGNGSGEVIQG